MSVVAPIPLAQAPLLARPFYGGGDPGPIVSTMAHVPELLEAALAFIGAALGPSSVDWRTKEIVILRTSARFGCRYCVDTHTPVALDSGLSPTQVRALRCDGPGVEEAFPDGRDRALLGWVDAVASTAGRVPEGVENAVRSAFSEAEIVELTVVTGCTLFLNRYATALGLPTAPAVRERLEREGFAA